MRFREALAFVPGYAGALSGLADIRAANGDLEGARPLYARAAPLRRCPSSPRASATSLAQLGREAGAERAWKRADELERLFAANGGRNLLETAEFDLNHDRNFRSALDRARRGPAERPSVEGDHVLAWALYKNDRCAEARIVSLRSLPAGHARRRRALPPQPDRGAASATPAAAAGTRPESRRSIRRTWTRRPPRGGCRARRRDGRRRGACLRRRLRASRRGAARARRLRLLRRRRRRRARPHRQRRRPGGR